MPEPYDETAIQSICDRQVHRPGQVGHHHHRALEHPDEQQFAAGVIGVDLRGQLRDPLAAAART